MSMTTEKVKPIVGTRKQTRFCGVCKLCSKWYAHDATIEYSAVGWIHPTVEECKAALPSVLGLEWATDEERDSQAFYQKLQRMALMAHANKWTFAKTMPDTPHYWVLRKNWIGDFAEFVIATRTMGQIIKFGRTNYNILNMNEHRYWAMGERHRPPGVEYLLNRAVRLRYEPEPEPWFDASSSWWSEPVERAVINEMNPNMARVLDVGGTCLNVARIVEGGYRAIGTPQDMARVMAEHPTARILHTEVEQFVPTDPEPFDLAIAGFGAGDYLTYRDIKRMQYMTRPEGKVIVQHRVKTDLGYAAREVLATGTVIEVGGFMQWTIGGKWTPAP
jgi:hypothetical protein